MHSLLLCGLSANGKALVGSIWDRTGRMANGALDIGADLVGAGVKGVKKLYAGAEGIYVKGSAKVLLSIQDLEVQNYIDVNTGKVIKTLEDIYRCRYGWRW